MEERRERNGLDPRQQDGSVRVVVPERDPPALIAGRVHGHCQLVGVGGGIVERGEVLVENPVQP